MGSISNTYQRLRHSVIRLLQYCWEGVWRDPSKSLKVRTLKILNLSVRTFMDSDLQSRAAALTYRTLLAIVPAFALLFAIGRGFNLQDLLLSQLYKIFPAQQQAMSTAISFVDSYLKEASQGVFLGVGIVFLLWTLISLLSHIESSFNHLWGVKRGRSIYRKITDYTSICLLVPVMMVCSAGINIFMGTMFDTLFGTHADYPAISIILDCAPFLLTCVAFTLSYLLIPNTRVSLKYAAIAGLISGVAFQIIQLLFISGQVYVAKYNAIYGSFAFLPLLLIWLQISWLILLFGCTLTFSMQNIFHFTFTTGTQEPSQLHTRSLTVAAAAIITSRFVRRLRPMTVGEMSAHYGLPVRQLSGIVDTMHAAGLVHFVSLEKERQGITPAIDPSVFTVGMLLQTIESHGSRGYMPEFARRFKQVSEVVDTIAGEAYAAGSGILLADIPVAHPPRTK